MKNKRKRAACLLLAVLCVVQLLTMFCVSATAAGETVYTGVLEDLQRDPDFKVEDYPGDFNNFGFQVITIAEGVGRELFVYVYQPAGDSMQLIADSINISREKDAKEFFNYKLQLINQQGVFQKYIVLGFLLETKAERYYEITNIYRSPVSEGEESTGYDDGNAISGVSFPVGKGFTFSNNQDGTTSVYVEDVDFVLLDSKYVSYLYYPKTFLFWESATDLDVHHIAFSTKRKIDKLLEADVYYVQQSAKKIMTDVVNDQPVFEYEFGNKETCYAELKADKDMIYDGGWFSVDYNWKTILTTQEFFDTEETDRMYSCGLLDIGVRTNLKDTEINNMKKTDYVLRFCYTEHLTVSLGNAYLPFEDYTVVGNVSVLRLKFETDGKIYDLGVVDNMQTGSGEPGNDPETWTEFSDWFEKMLAVIFGIVLVAILGPLLFPLIGKLFATVFDGIKWIIEKILLLLTWPFRALFKANRK